MWRDEIMNGMRPRFPWTSFRDGESVGPGDRREEPAELVGDKSAGKERVSKEALVI